MILAAMLALALSTAEADKALDIYFIDVDGGAATLIVTPERESILIDSGWPGRDDRDPKRIVHVLKDVAGLGRIDHLVTTHWHMDHYGGVEGLARLVPIGRYWDRGLPEDGNPSLDFPDGPGPDDPLGIAYRKASAGRRKPLKAGDSLPLKGEARLEVLAGGREVVVRPASDSDRVNPLCESAPPDAAVDPSDNARSLALKLWFKEFDFLDCGDLTWNVEKKLVCPRDLIGPIDLYQVTHHGMDISNHPTLVRTIAPTVAVMNNGPRKGGAAGTVRLLKSIPSIQAAYQLHKNAATGPDENTDPALIVNADPTGGRFLRVSVAADGKSFTVQAGGEGTKRTFATK